MVIFLSRSSTKIITYFYLHANVIDYVGTTTITINIKGTLINTHFELIKKGKFFQLEIFFYQKTNLTMTKEIQIGPLSFL